MTINSLISDSLLNSFNRREIAAFDVVYRSYYEEMFFFANKLFEDQTNIAEDIVQDVFMTIWSNKSQFETESHLKGYIYQSIRNKIKNLIIHRKCIQKFNMDVVNQMANGDVYMVEAEVFSLLKRSIDLLPQECAEVFRLYAEGWNAKEIAEITGKSVNTIYSQKQTAIKILKNKMDKKSFIFFLFFFNFN